MFNKIIDNFFTRLSDKDTSPYAYSSPKTLFKRTIRYQLASMGFPITPNDKFLYSLKNKHKGKRCFIIGNGPSLNACDLTMLKDEVTFGFNSIFLNFEKMGFAPTYYIVEDCLVAEDRSKEIEAFKGCYKFFGNHLNYCLKPNENTFWLNVIMNYNEYENFPHFSNDFVRRLWVGGTVTYLALQMAYYMGFTEVYMIGYDHSYTIPNSADLNTQTARITSNESDPNHFHPDYFGKGYRWHDPRVDRMELSYKRAKKVFEKDGRKILNATVGGKLEVFERVDYKSLF